MLTLEEARSYLNSLDQPPCHGQDQWCAVAGRDWVQIGDSAHDPGKSHVQDCGGYPPWGDNPNDMSYGEPHWNSFVLFKDYNCFALPDTWGKKGGKGKGCACTIF